MTETAGPPPPESKPEAAKAEDTRPAAPTAHPPRGSLPPGIPQARAIERRKPSLPLIWIVPLLAILAGLGLVVKSVLETGPTVHIRFSNAEGLEAGQTKIKYKSVDIGSVKAVTLSPDHKGVIVTADMAREASDLLETDTRFWVVRPRVAGGQVSGLSTLLSGSYIAIDPGKSESSERDFEGLDAAPTVTHDEPGREFILHGADLGSLDVGSPVYFRRIQVGEITALELDRDGSGVTLHFFVHSPYERFVTTNTRFWQASGVDVALDATGFRVQTQSVMALLVGGVAFEAPPDSPPEGPAPAEQRFTLFADQGTAMKRTESEVATLVAYFNESVRGLSPGAPVDLRGVTIGEVKSIDVQFDPATQNFRFPVALAIYVDRLNARHANDAALGASERDALLSRSIARGLRAQLRTGSLLTGQRYVALDFFPGAKAVNIDPHKMPREIPTVPGTFEDLQQTLTDLAKKLDRLPVEEITADLHKSLVTLDRTLADVDQLVGRANADIAPQLRDTLSEAQETLRDARSLLSSDAPVQDDVRQALREMTRAARSLHELTDYIERHPDAFLRGKPADPKESK